MEYFRKAFLAGCGFALGLLSTVLVAVTISGTITSFSSGEVVSAAKINENFQSLRGAIEGLPDCTDYSVKLKPSSFQAIADNDVKVTRTFDTEEFDPQNMHDPGTNPGRITIQRPGKYRAYGRIVFSNNGNTGGFRRMAITLNGAIVDETLDTVTSGDNVTIEIEDVYDLSAGQYLELQSAVQSGNGTVQTSTNDRFILTRLCSN